ncbi:MAG: peptide chain release factor N(5)-glutamine methyltransferase [Lachnospiraceae bacterium]|nr:peptide chain release factor N(5)-glutamine methyltransferase [Lachnospiraceae bacterium]
MTYREALEKGREQLTEAGIPDPHIDAELLLMHVCGCGKSEKFMNPGRVLSSDEEARLSELLDRRCEHIPLQHLTGVQNFMGMDFKVSSGVLIPRADTEILVEEVMRDGANGASILDMCTGSGCIILSLIKYVSEVRGTGADISTEALAIARENGKTLGLAAEFIQSDLYENIDGCFDIIVSNPPYIKTDVIATLMPEVRDHDPYIALDGGEDGLDFYRKIIAGAVSHLNRNGKVYLEIGYDEQDAVEEILRNNSFKNITTIKDYSDLPRVVKAEI